MFSLQEKGRPILVYCLSEAISLNELGTISLYAGTFKKLSTPFSINFAIETLARNSGIRGNGNHRTFAKFACISDAKRSTLGTMSDYLLAYWRCFSLKGIGNGITTTTNALIFISLHPILTLGLILRVVMIN